MTATPAWETVKEIMREAPARLPWRSDELRYAADEAAYVIAGWQMRSEQRAKGHTIYRLPEYQDGMVIYPTLRFHGSLDDLVMNDLGPIATSPGFHYTIPGVLRPARVAYREVVSSLPSLLALLAGLIAAILWGPRVLDFLHWNIAVLGWERAIELWQRAHP